MSKLCQYGQYVIVKTCIEVHGIATKPRYIEKNKIARTNCRQYLNLDD